MENNPSDAEKLRATTAERESQRKVVHQAGHELQREQLWAKQASRETLQFTSSQRLSKGANKDLAHDLAQSEHEIVSEFIMQKTYKDPSKPQHLCPVC